VKFNLSIYIYIYIQGSQPPGKPGKSLEFGRPGKSLEKAWNFIKTPGKL